MNTSNERTFFLLALLLGSVLVTFFVFQPFLSTVALAAVFAAILYPLYHFLSSQLGKGAIATLATLAVGFLLILIPVAVIGGIILDESREQYTSLTAGANATSIEQVALNIGAWAEPYVPGANAYAKTISLEINGYLQLGLAWLLQHVGIAFTSILSFILNLLIFLMALYFFLQHGAAFQRHVIDRSPLHNEDGRTILKHLSRTVNSVVRGSLVIAVAQGTLAGIGFAIFGLPNPALWGAATSLAALVPGVGTTLVTIPAAIYLFISGNVGASIGLLVWGLLLVGLIDNFLGPYLIGKGARMHPLIIFLSVLGGVAFYGPIGVFLGPLSTSFLFGVYEIYARHSEVPA